MFFKFKSFLILFRCIAKFFFIGRTDKKIENPKKVIIVQMAKLGDMVCTTPMFRAIKEKYPELEVIVVGNSINQKILEGNKDVDKYIIFDGFFSVIKKIKQEKIDFACVTAPDFTSLSVLYLSSIPMICAPRIENGYSPYETLEYKILSNFVIKKPHKMGSYAPREYLRLLEPIDIFTDNTKKHLVFSQEAYKNVSDYLEKNNIKKEDLIVGISPSAGSKIKCWSTEKFAQFADYIYKKYNAKVIIIGSERDKEKVEEMIRFLHKDTKIFNVLNIFNIDELKALISKMNIFISVDTGPIYIAEAFNVATIDIIGAVSEVEQPPVSDIHRVVYLRDRKKPELHIMNARVYNKKEVLRQINEISVEMVNVEFDNLIKELFKK